MNESEFQERIKTHFSAKDKIEPQCISTQNLKADRVIEDLYIGFLIGFVKIKAWKIGWTRAFNRNLYKNGMSTD